MAKFLNRDRIKEAMSDYINDNNFKEQNEKLKEDMVSLRVLAWGWNDKGEVDPTIRESNITVLDNLDLFTFTVIPNSKDIQSRIKYYEEKGDKEKLRNLKLLHSMATDTAYITPVADPETKKLAYFITVGQELGDKIKSWGYSEGQENKAFAFTIFHEFTHFLRSDVNPWKDERLKEKYPNVSHSEWNVMQDAFINSNGLRQFYDTASALLDKLGVRGKTVGSFLSNPVYLQTVDDLKDKFDKNNTAEFKKAVADRLIEYHKQLGGSLNEKDEADLRESIMETDDEHFEKLVANLKEVGSSEKFFSDLNEKWKSKLADYIDNGLFPDNMKLPTKYIDISNFVKNNALAFENGDASFMDEDMWADYLNKANTLFPPSKGKGKGKGNGNGKGKGKGGSPSDQTQDHANSHEVDSDDMVELDEKEVNDEISRIAHKTDEISRKIEDVFNKNNRDFGTMLGQKMDKQLKLSKHELMMRAIRTALRASIVMPKTFIEQKVLPAINGPLNHIRNIANQQRVSSGQQPLGSPPPKGVMASMVVTKKEPALVMMFIDESGSVSDDMLSAAKTAIANVCKERDLTVITFSNSAADPKNMGKYLEPSVFNPKKSDVDDFVKRLATGGTDNPMQYTANLDKIFSDENFKQKLQRELDKQQVGLKVEDIVKAAKKGELTAISITDGAIPGYKVNSDEESFLDKIVANDKTPLTIVTWNPLTEANVLSNVDKNKRKKYVRIIGVK